MNRIGYFRIRFCHQAFACKYSDARAHCKHIHRENKKFKIIEQQKEPKSVVGFQKALFTQIAFFY